jgi:cell division protein ZapA (FtsZ GTPase activity inhibitor)
MDMDRAGFRELVDKSIKIVAAEGEVSISKLAYMLNIPPSKACYILKAASEIDPRIAYLRGRAVWQDGEWDGQKPE